MKTNIHFNMDKTGILCGAALLVTLTGFTARADGVHIGINVPVPEPPAIVVSPPTVTVQDDYVFYPAYNVYYNTTRHEFCYLNGGVWATGPAPLGFSASVVLGSPSVHMDFHDSPAHHHAEIIKRYPKDWAPARDDHREIRREEDRRDDHRDDRR